VSVSVNVCVFCVCESVFVCLFVCVFVFLCELSDTGTCFYHSRPTLLSSL
jgi:hypothetical protein